MPQQCTACANPERARYLTIETFSILYIILLGPFCTVFPLPFVFRFRSVQFIVLVVAEIIIVLLSITMYYITKRNNFGFKEKEFLREYQNRQRSGIEAGKLTSITVKCQKKKNKRSRQAELSAVPLSDADVSNILQNYCYICCQHVTERTQHCLICEQCVDGFDHHCVYLGSCVGDANKRYFYGFLGTVLVISLFQLFTAVTEMVLTIIISKGAQIQNQNLQQTKALWVLAPIIINVLLNIFPLYFSMYISCYHCGLHKHKMTTYEYIQDVNDRLENNGITKREAYAFKKCPCVDLKCAICLTNATYRNKQDSESSSSSSDVEYAPFGTDSQGEQMINYDTSRKLESSVAIKMEVQIDNNAYTQPKYAQVRTHRLISSALGAVFPVSHQGSEQSSLSRNNLRPKSEISVYSASKSAYNEINLAQSYVDKNNPENDLDASKRTLKPLRDLQSLLDKNRQLKVDSENNSSNALADGDNYNFPLKLRKHKKKKHTID